MSCARSRASSPNDAVPVTALAVLAAVVKAAMPSAPRRARVAPPQAVADRKAACPAARVLAVATIRRVALQVQAQVERTATVRARKEAPPPAVNEVAVVLLAAVGQQAAEALRVAQAVLLADKVP